jgi:hypothetical protein
MKLRGEPFRRAWRVHNLACFLGMSAVLCASIQGCSGRSEKNAAPGGSAGEVANPSPDDPNDPQDPSNFACPLGDCEPIGTRVEPMPPPVCPTDEPGEGSGCTVDELQCSYGSSSAAYCRRYLVCTAGAWTVPPNRVSTCKMQPPEQCPAEPQPGATCTASEVSGFVPCEYDGAISCYCLGTPVGVPGTTSEWECYGPPRNGACPELLPNIGDGCAVNGQACHYGVVQQGCYAPYADVYCYQGAWEASSPTCSL